MERNKQIQLFDSPEFGRIRVATDENGTPLFAATDVATALGYTNPPKAVVNHCKSGNITKRYIAHPNGVGGVNVLFIKESEVYRLVLRSNLPDAEKFQDWVCMDILPAIGKHGFYATPNTVAKMLADPDGMILMLQEFKKEQTKRKEAEKQIARLAPKAALMERVLDSDQKIDIGQAAKILQLPFGRNKLFAQLRERGIFFTGRNEPKQTYIERGYFELREKWIDRDNHDGFAVIKVLVTQRGLDFLARLFNVTQSNPELAEVI